MLFTLQDADTRNDIILLVLLVCMSFLKYCGKIEDNVFCVSLGIIGTYLAQGATPSDKK